MGREDRKGRGAVVAIALAAVTAGTMFGLGEVRADDRCTGTICDLYYGGSPAPKPVQPTAPAQPGVPAGATPMTVPSLSVPSPSGFFGKVFGGGKSNDPAAASGQPQGASPAATATAGQSGTSSSFVNVGGGGLTKMFSGGSQDRCGGTLCDLFYGGSSSQDRDSPGMQQSSAIPGHDWTSTRKPAPSDAYQAPAVTPAYYGAAAQPPSPITPQVAETRRRIAEAAEREKQRCRSSGSDPWGCYRH